jgi:hypothetical protein
MFILYYCNLMSDGHPQCGIVGWVGNFSSCAAIFETAWVVQALSCVCLGYCMGGIGESK